MPRQGQRLVPLLQQERLDRRPLLPVLRGRSPWAMPPRQLARKRQAGQASPAGVATATAPGAEAVGCRRADGRRRSADLVQLINVLGQFGHAGGCFAGLLCPGQLVFCRLLARDGALGQGEFVGCSRSGFLVFDARLHCAAGRASLQPPLRRWGCCRELAAESVEIAAFVPPEPGDASPTGVANRSGLVRHLQHGADALTRLTLPWMKASGLARISATSIWSSDTLAGAVGVGQAASRIARLYGDAIGRSGARAGGRGYCAEAC